MNKWIAPDRNGSIRTKKKRSERCLTFCQNVFVLPKFFSGMLASEAEGGSFGMMLMSDETTIGTIPAAVFPRYIIFISLL
jgi:hypothetical protein